MKTTYTRSTQLIALAGLALGSTALAQPCPQDCPQQSRITICYEGGRVDGWGAPDDPATPRASFNALLATIPPVKGFDNANTNSRFGHTFQNLPCGIMGATLTISIRAENDISQNDSLGLQWTGSGFVFGTALDALPGAGGTWNPGQTNTVTLNLTAIPGLIVSMNANRALDLYLQDDSSIEHARLTINVCPCDGPYRVYTVGGVDNMAAPTEPTSRRPRLTALRTTPPFLWVDNDTCPIDRGWGHSFTGLPSGIVRADFALRARPCGGSSNDSLNFDLLNLGSTETFSRGFQFSTMATPWVSPTNPLTNFFFNLGTTLPTQVCGSNLLGNFGDRIFDVYIQDDTGVDAARLRVQPCPPRRLIWGWPVLAKGEAVLDYSPITRRLLITNLGSSGQDGVEIDAFGTDQLDFDLAPGTMTGLPMESTFHIQAHGDVDDDGAAELIGEMVAAKHFPDGLWLSSTVCPQTPDGTPGCATWVLSNSETGESVEVCLPCDSGWVMTESVEVSKTGKTGTASGKHYGFMKMRDFQRFTTSSGESFIGDTVELETDRRAPHVDVMSFSWGLARQGDYSVGIVDGGCVLFGNRHRQLGSSCAINPNGNALSISNIGSSGQDGVQIDLGVADEFVMQFDTICAGTYENCDTANLQYNVAFTGSLGGVDGLPVGHSSVSRFRPAFFDVFYDISDTGSQTTKMVFIDGEGNMVGEYDLPVAAGQFEVEGPGEPGGCGKQAVTIGGVRTACMRWDWKKDMIFRFPGLAPISARQIRILASSPTIPFDHVSSVAFTATGMSDIDIFDQLTIQVQPPVTCYADFNQDGGIDGSDIQAFFESWQAGDAGADTNGDGGIDGSDVEVFFIQWQNGGC